MHVNKEVMPKWMQRVLNILQVSEKNIWQTLI